jgi:hypothetical protein
MQELALTYTRAYTCLSFNSYFYEHNGQHTHTPQRGTRQAPGTEETSCGFQVAQDGAPELETNQHPQPSHITGARQPLAGWET